jgi:hypothetical protein
MKNLCGCGTELLTWRLSPANETGWQCMDCLRRPGEPPGFCPELDREFTETKVNAILEDLNGHQLVYVSNGDQGDWLIMTVAKKCRETGFYDQYSILAFLIEELNATHAAYWKGISEGVISGIDPRSRCWCGELAKVFIVGGESFCGSEHKQQAGQKDR